MEKQKFDESQRCIASLLKKNYISDEKQIYTYINTIIGYYDEEVGIFYDDQGKEYSVLDSDSVMFDPNPYVCGNMTTIDEAYELYTDGSSGDIQNILDAYHERESTYFYLAELDDEYCVNYLKLNFDQTMDDYSFDFEPDEELLDKADSNNKEDNRPVIKDKDLENNIKNGVYSKEDLIKIKNSLTTSKDILTNLIKLSENKMNDLSSKEETDIIDVDDLYKKVTKTLISQDEPARRLIVEIARLLMNDVKKEGILLTGPSGVGKTELIRLISENIGRPLLIVDSLQLTSPGYVGKNIEECLWELYEKCGKDKEKTENAIVYFDEIDKKGSERKDDVAGKGVLNVLLKFLDGTTYTATSSQDSLFSKSTINIDTSRMLVLAGGAFSDVYKEEKKNSIGFASEKITKKRYEPTVEDFVEKGMMSDEFMGRMNVIIRLNSLNRNDYKDILLKSDKSPVKIQKENFKKLKVDVHFTDKALDEMALQAEVNKIGVRGLFGIVSNSTYKAFDKALTSKEKINKIIITEETVKDSNNFECEKQKVKEKI